MLALERLKRALHRDDATERLVHGGLESPYRLLQCRCVAAVYDHRDEHGSSQY
jgi:hypothetical protein